MARFVWAASAILALAMVSQATSVSTPAAEVSGTPTYTISSDGLKMLFANPFDCEKPATNSSTWVIAMEQPQTVFSFQIAVTDPNLIVEQEQVAVRVGNSDPVREGAASNPLCAVADLTSTSAMVDFECTNPVTGYFITVSMNNGGKMNVCGLSANLGFAALPPVTSIVGPSIFVPASELNTPESPEQMAAAQLLSTRVTAAKAFAPTHLSTYRHGVESFSNLATDSKAPAPAPHSLAPKTAVDSLPALPKVKTPAPAHAPASKAVPVPAPKAGEAAGAVIAGPFGAVCLLVLPARGAPVPAPATQPEPAKPPAQAETADSSPGPSLAPLCFLVQPLEAEPVAVQKFLEKVPAKAPSPVPVAHSPELVSLKLTPVPTPGKAVELLLQDPSKAPTPAPAAHSPELVSLKLAPAPSPIKAVELLKVSTPVHSPAAGHKLAPSPGPAPVTAHLLPAVPVIVAPVPASGSLEINSIESSPPPSPTLTPTPVATQTASPQTGSSQATTKSGSSGLSGGDIAGIVIGVLAAVAVAAAIALYVVHRQRSHRRPAQHPLRSNTAYEP